MENPNEVQPIDGYVKNLLEHIVKKYDVLVKDLNAPTRGERLEAALAAQSESNGFYSMEIMVGRRVSSDDPKDVSLHFLLLTQGLHPQDPREFYAGFAHQYWPNTEKKPTA